MNDIASIADDPKYQLEPPPSRYSKLHVGMLIWFVFLLFFCLFYPYEDGQPNWFGAGIDLVFIAIYSMEVTLRYVRVKKLERMYRHFEALKRVVKTPTSQYDKETNTTTFNWLISLSPDQVDRMERERKK